MAKNLAKNVAKSANTKQSKTQKAKAAPMKNAAAKTAVPKASASKAKAAKPAVKAAGPKAAAPKAAAPKKASKPVSKAATKAVSKAQTAQAAKAEKSSKAKTAKATSKADAQEMMDGLASGDLVLQINTLLDSAVDAAMEIGQMEAGVDGVTEDEVQDAVARLSAVRKRAWEALMMTFPDLIDRLMFTEMIECAYEDEEAGAIRFAGSAIGWDEIGNQFVIMGRRGDVWEGEGKLLETVLGDGEMDDGSVVLSR